MSDYPLGVGDVALDLAQGRPVHVIEATSQTVAEWSDANDYDLADNYGNSRLGTTEDDLVYDVVYCSSAKSEPSKSYAMPKSRLLRIETEATDDGRPVYQRAVVDVLTSTFLALHESEMGHRVDGLADLLEMSFGSDIVSEAQELADVDQTIQASGE